MLNGYVCFSCRRWLQSVAKTRRYSVAALRREEEDDVASRKRFNSVGIQQVGDRIHAQLFKNSSSTTNQALTELSRQHLTQHQLLGKNSEVSEEVNFTIPRLYGQTLDEHFYKLGSEVSQPYRTLADDLASTDLPSRPAVWIRRPGWTRYDENGATAVDYPTESILCFDTEVMYKHSPYAVMACAASDKAWYSWLSPWLLGTSSSVEHLIPLGKDDKLIVGHNVGYDRSRVAEEYSLKRSKLRFLDTLSLHQAANGMCSRQRPAWMKHQKKRDTRAKLMSQEPELLKELEDDIVEDLWLDQSSTNSLREVARFHCQIDVKKDMRKIFEEVDPKVVLAQLDESLDYCAEDVRLAHLVYKKVFPNYMTIAPHPVSFAGLLHMNSMILPVNRGWLRYIERAEQKYQELSDLVKSKLALMAEETVKLKDEPERYQYDPWLKQLDWTMKPIRKVVNKKTGEERLAKNQKLPGMPEWYRDLFTSSDSQINLTVRTRISPILLRMSWSGQPLVWSDKYGWVIRTDTEEATELFHAQKYDALDMSSEKIDAVREDHNAVYFKVPHKDGPKARVASPLAKAFDQHFEDGLLQSEFQLAKEALEMNAACSYWISSRDRITSQMLVWQKDNSDVGIILPQTVAMGTITRRATEPTWMTASNAKRTRVGSELKSMVQAPPGYCFVGADVDSEELWIASLMGDAQFGLHGSTALGWMTLEGTKSKGTDLHSRTASILGISRNNAKIFNYGRIYGAGLKFAIQLLQRFNPSLTEAEAKKTAEALYEATKGKKGKVKATGMKGFWRGGTESYVFNRLEAMAEQETPRTPVLGCGITQALLSRNLAPGSFLTSRVNWAIQSSGVDYLHLLITSMEYLIRLYALDARISITVHDEIRYLVAEKDKYMAAFAMQVSNLWTRAMFSQELGINDLPQSCAFFSEVDIDHVLRKETNMDCITPSNLEAIPPGRSLDIHEILEAVKDDPRSSKLSMPLYDWPYTPRPRVFKDIDGEDLRYLQAQNMKSAKDVETLYSTK